MANDRLWLRCSKCGDRILMFKYYPCGLGFIYHSKINLQTFLNDHLCGCHGSKTSLNGDEIELVNERQLHELEGQVTPSGKEGDNA